MTSLTTDTPVGQFVADRPLRARVFQRLGIDFCCGGKVSLAEACRRKGLDAATTLETLLTEEDTGAAQPVEHMTMAALCDHIEQTHHDRLREELPRLDAMLHKVAMVHGLHHPWLHDMTETFSGFETELVQHMWKEERVLFPLIRQIEAGDSDAIQTAFSVSSPIAVMEHEHEEAGRALARLRDLSNGFTPPEGACNTFRALLEGLRALEEDMHWHVHKENNILFPRALAAAGH